jgi:thiol-disulfide isomerase/thioredoxin
LICAAIVLTAPLAAQKTPKKSAQAPAPVKPPTEDEALEESLAEAGSSAVEYSRTLERHLKRYPNSEKKSEIVRVLAQAALEQRDAKRLLLYGVPVLDDGNRNLALMDYVCRALLERAAEGDAAKALVYARRMSVIAGEQRKEFAEDKSFKMSRARRMEELDAAMGRALWHEARALRMTGEKIAALEAIEKSWAAAPLEDTARERSAQFESLGQKREAAGAFADAIATGGLDLTDSADRLRLQTLAGDQAGSVLLEAWARSETRNREREARFREADPNFGAKRILDYTLSATEGAPLPLKSLLGKVVVIDFWATWCGPCRAQHPLYEEVKRRFANRKDVVFLAISTDENRESVPGFLESMGWPKLAYYDDGLASSQRISSIPTTMILDKEGGVASRLHGFSADRFVDMLTARIREALGEAE